MVLILEQGLVGIHIWCEFRESISEVKEIRDAIRFVMGGFVRDGQTEDGQTESISIVPRRKLWGTKIIVTCVLNKL